MKKIAVTLVALFLSLYTNAQEARQVELSDTLNFMTEYRQFAAFVVSQPSLSKPVADSLIARQDTLMHRYRVLKPQLSAQQVEEYNRLKGRYLRKMLSYRGERFSDGLQATGDTIVKTTNRVGKAVGGFIKGVLDK